jgi:hypothetical protein
VTPAQIEGMIDRLCGLFPTTQIGRNTVKNAWITDEFLLDATVDEARLVVEWVKEWCDKFPASLKEMRKIFILVRNRKPVDVKSGKGCTICDGTLWDNGIRYDSKAKRISEQYKTIFMHKVYEVVKPCPECRGADWVLPDTSQ